jgi:hypothetical protein
MPIRDSDRSPALLAVSLGLDQVRPLLAFTSNKYWSKPSLIEVPQLPDDTPAK